MNRRKVTEVIISPEKTVEYTSRKPVDHVLILIPGMLSNGEWVDRIEHGYNNYKIVKAGSGYIGPLDLFTRFGIVKLRYKVASAIFNSIIEYNNINISIIAHSMGCSILSEIADDIKYKFKNIFLLGSICHEKMANNIIKLGNNIVNDCGVNDRWPLRAEALRGDVYGATGTYGFSDTTHITNRRFTNDHFDCVSIQHIRKNIIPIIECNYEETTSFEETKFPIWKHKLYSYIIRFFLFSPFPFPFPTIIVWIAFSIYLIKLIF